MLPYQEQVNKWIEEKNIWRAKQYLRGRISSNGFDPWVFETYGILMMDSQEILEAGRYLFLSGRRNANHSESIDYYLNTFRKGTNQHLFATFPKCVKILSWEELPSTLKNDLKELGIEEFFLENQNTRVQGFTKWENFKSFVAMAVFILLIVLTMIGIIVNTATGIRFVIKHIRNIIG